MNATVVVSLLDTDDSEHLLRAMHRLLRPADAAAVALLRPPEPQMGIAALEMVGRDVAVVTRAGGAWVQGAETLSGRCYAWCRDDAEAEALPPSGAVPIVAGSVDELAWELVRRLTGDLRDARDRPDAPRSPGSNEVWASTSAGSVPSGPSVEPASGRPGSPPGNRDRRLPRTPGWAQARPPDTAEPRIEEGVRRSGSEGSAGGREAAVAEDPGGGHAAPPPPATAPTAPLAALAERLRVSQAPAARLMAVPMTRSNGRARSWPRLLQARDLLRRIGSPGHGAEPDLAVLGQALVRFHSTLVAVGTPKGGPGKTTEAAALGVLGARAVEPHGGSAVLIDANLNNPDAWRQLGVPSDAITLREIVDAINRGIVVPNGEFARNERLRVLPERRTGAVAYAAHEIARLNEHLRLRHTLIVVDLANSLPSLSGGRVEALVAHWLVHADVVVIPIDLGEASIVAAGEMLDAIELMVAKGGTVPMPGLVMPLLLPTEGRRALELPVFAEVLDHFRNAGATVVEVPYSVDVQTASHRRSPLVGASRRADRGFAGVLRAVVAARQAQGVPSRHA